jgi:hypothetical protein
MAAANKGEMDLRFVIFSKLQYCVRMNKFPINIHHVRNICAFNRVGGESSIGR